MTNDASDIAIGLPDLDGSAELTTIAIRRAALDHLTAWDASQRLMAVHESGHACAAAALGIGVQAIDIQGRHGGQTETVGPGIDTALPWETSQRLLDRIVVSMAGAAAERAILGEHTSGAGSDYDHAVIEATAWLQAGFGGPEIFIGEGGLGYGYLTEEIRSMTLARIRELLEQASSRADALVAEHRDGILHVASAVYEHRRLTDERLAAVLAAAGFPATPSP